MSGSERRERIVSELVERRHLTAQQLSAEIGVSEATVRRDLKQLDAEGKVELNYGSATIRRLSDFSFQSKVNRNTAGKQIIGRLAADLIADGDQVFLDSGTTSFAVAPHLKRKRGLSVIVHSARLALELDAPGLSVILLGGQYRAERMDTVGPLTASALNQLHGYICMIGADGLRMDVGLFAADIESADLYRRAVGNARETILLVDHTKFLAPALYKIVEWDAISRVVTDQQPPPEWEEFFQRKQIQLICEASPQPAGEPHHQGV